MQCLYKQARKGFRPPSAMQGIGCFQNLRIFLRNCLEIFWIFLGIYLGGFFWRNFFGGNFLEEFFGRFFWKNFLGDIFWEDFFGRIFWEELFGRNYLVEINKELMFLSRFWSKFVSMHRKKEGRIFNP